jgi:hypothetical protein
VFPKGLGSLGDIAKVVQAAKELPAKLEAMKAELANERVEAETGGGLVKVQANGNREIIGIEIDPEVIDKDDPGMLAAFIQAGVNEALRKADDLVKDRMRQIAGGYNIGSIPGLMPGMGD